MGKSILKLRGACENNLKELNLEIAHDSLVVVTGISGSGKSSLAFDTIYAEGQRRYIETFSPYTRQFLDRLKKPQIDSIENVRPAIAIQQRTRVTNSRSTVGSMTNINDYLKILWSTFATPICPSCNEELKSWNANKLASELKEEAKDSTLLITAPVPIQIEHLNEQSRRKAIKHTVERLQILGFTRSINPETRTIDNFEDTPYPELDSGNRLLLLIDRFKGGSIPLTRLRESIDQAFSISEGICLSIVIGDPPLKQEHFNFFCCQKCGTKIREVRQSLFSFNHPLGACSTCKGFGRVLELDINACIPNPNLSLSEGAIVCWAGGSASKLQTRLIKFCTEKNISITTPWRKLSDEQKHEILHSNSRTYRGLFPWFKKLEKKIYKMHVRVFLARYRGQFTCPECNGKRLKKEALIYKINGLCLPDLWEMPIVKLRQWVLELMEKLRGEDKLSREIQDLFNSVTARLNFLIDLGLTYITLDRSGKTLSGGETQRVNLVTALGSELISTHFVLDEPSVGLHPRDTERLIRSIRALQLKGNSLLVVEHDTDFIDSADHIVELGPKAGTEGGHVVFSGSPSKWRGIDLLSVHPKSLEKSSLPGGDKLRIKNATARNLKNISFDIPLNLFVCITGVSGSGKSTLVNEVLKKAHDNFINKWRPTLKENLVDGFEHIDQLLLVDQSPLVKSPRANVATYTGLWDHLRDYLSESSDSKKLGLTRSSFSFNVDAGRCPLCKGAGSIKEDMQFLSDIYIQCELCAGKRFQSKVLEVRFNGFNVSDYLSLSVEKCAEIFHDDKKLATASETLVKLGLGHLSLGHPLSQLSGGEAQRLKLAPFVEKSLKAKSLLILDEPTTGLHVMDIKKLVDLIRVIRDNGHSVLCVEHNLTLISHADWIVDLGPEGGEAGGHLVTEGTPKDLVKPSHPGAKDSHTAKYLLLYNDRVASKSANTKIFRRESAKNSSKDRFLAISGAREHNLKNIDLSVPLDKMVAFTGVSGSGKSTIAKDIIYAEGQRRYLDCLSPYARQYITELKKPEIDSISNVMPTICVAQHTFQPSRLSTIATMSEVYNFLRLLYVKAGTQYCPQDDVPITPLSSDRIAEDIKKSRVTLLRILAPVIKLKKGNHKSVFERAIKSEITEIRVDGVFCSPSSVAEGLTRSKSHTIEFTIAKFNPQTVPIDLLKDSIEQALSIGGGNLIVFESGNERLLSIERSCPICGEGFFKPDPEDLSFNSRRGRCMSCMGSGKNEKGELCPSCKGARLNKAALSLKLDSFNIFDSCRLDSFGLREFLNNYRFASRTAAVTETILPELHSKLDTLISLGLGQIELNRDCSSLSGGELQRLRLSAASSSTLAGAMYIFDEPSAGLHPLDNFKVLEKLRDLQTRGNSVIVIEHDAESILACDHVVEVGPGGGSDGGTIVFNGAISKFLGNDASPTSKAIRQEKIGIKPTSMSTKFEKLTISGGTKNNISDLKVSLPLDRIVCVAGVSGAGKSSLVHGLIYDTISAGERGKIWKSRYSRIESTKEIERVVCVDQSPIGKTSRSTPASYLKIWDEIRKLFAATLEAKSRGYTESFFSFNSGKGRCPHCKGQGQIKLEMNFLADAVVECEHCLGTRYQDIARGVHYLGRTINEVLDLTFDEAKSVFANHPKIYRALHQACELGLGYLTLGQSSATLSGGESQRIKLISELSARRRGHTLFILDEPSTGLHKLDIRRLLKVLRTLVELGNSVVLIENDQDILLGSDHILELGPGAGRNGGSVIFEGTPEKLLEKSPVWGKFLRERPRVQAAGNHF